MGSEDNAPMLSRHEVKSGDEPMLSVRDVKGIGRRQRDFLDWLATREGDVSWKDAWVWMGNRLGYLDGSKASQARMHQYVGKSLWGLIEPLVKRGLILIVDGETVNHSIMRSIRLLVRE